MTKEIIIRKAKKSELNKLVGMTVKLQNYLRAYEPTYMSGGKFRKIAKKYLAKGLNTSDGLILVAESKHKIIGFCFGKIIKPYIIFAHPKSGYIWDVYVEPQYWRRGIAKRFLEEQYKWFRKRKIRYVELDVDPKNKIGFSAWKKHGFRPLLVRKRLDLKKKK